MNFKFYVFFALLLTSFHAVAKDQQDTEEEGHIPEFGPGSLYEERDIDLNIALQQIGLAYAVSWIVYPITQPKIIEGKLGSWEEYGDNFGTLVYDQDEPFWNWFVHPISGSQLYLFYRARGHNRSGSMAMAFISSTLFEFTVEIYSEPASVQDLYQTPVIGSALGYGLEIVSTRLLHSDSQVARFFGRVLNPWTLVSHSKRYQITPAFFDNSGLGLSLRAEF